MIRTEEEVYKEKKETFYDLLSKLGGKVIFKKALLSRETPHTPTVYIHSVSDKDNFDNYGLQQDIIIQQLKWVYFQKYKKKYEK